MSGDWIEGNTQKLTDAQLRAALDAGQIVQVVNASYSAHDTTIGDVARVGYARKEYASDRFGDVTGVNWFFTGKGPIIVDDRCVFPGTWV